MGTEPGNTKPIPIYLMPGMAAGPLIFQYIKLPVDSFELYPMHWIKPQMGESLSHYANRLWGQINHENPVLIGVSFGGILVQEMAKIKPVRKLIIISSVKSKSEFPHRIKLARMTRAYKLLPTKWVRNVEDLAKYAFGKTVVKRLKLYERYLEMRDKEYLDWALHQLVNWDQEMPPQNIIHIQGEKDAVFPIQHIKECIKIPDGTHISIINRYRWFNKHLPSLILG